MSGEMFGAEWWEDVMREAAVLIDGAMESISDTYMQDGRLPNVKPPSFAELFDMPLEERSQLMARMMLHPDPAMQAGAVDALAQFTQPQEGAML